MRRAVALAAGAIAASTAAQPGAPQRGESPFVVTYCCDGDRHLAVGYPAFRDARKAPIRIGWQGRTVLLDPARSGSGARYINPIADLEWWSKGNGGTLGRLRDSQPLVTGCVES